MDNIEVFSTDYSKFKDKSLESWIEEKKKELNNRNKNERKNEKEDEIT